MLAIFLFYTWFSVIYVGRNLGKTRKVFSTVSDSTSLGFIFKTRAIKSRETDILPGTLRSPYVENDKELKWKKNKWNFKYLDWSECRCIAFQKNAFSRDHRESLFHDFVIVTNGNGRDGKCESKVTCAFRILCLTMKVKVNGILGNLIKQRTSVTLPSKAWRTAECFPIPIFSMISIAWWPAPRECTLSGNSELGGNE